jgi:aminoglycoside phosphotransferase (APT) family kinase protein
VSAGPSSSADADADAGHREHGVEVVVAHRERTTVRVGDVFVKVDADQRRLDREVAAMALAPIPTADVLWRNPPALALRTLRGVELGRLGEPSPASSSAWRATGALVRRLHDTAPPDWPARRPQGTDAELDAECRWLVEHAVLSERVVVRAREIARAVDRAWTPVFAHGDLQIRHVFVDGDDVTGVLDWSEAGPGDALFDIATLTLGHEERLDEVLAGYGTDVDRDVVRGWWARRSLLATRWLVEHGFDVTMPGAEVDVLRTLAAPAR